MPWAPAVRPRVAEGKWGHEVLVSLVRGIGCAVFPTFPCVPMRWVRVYRLERDRGPDVADETLAALRASLAPDLPGTARMIEAGRLKARNPIELAGCFAAVTAAAHSLVLLTGDPELLELTDAPCALEDLRAR